MAGNIYFLFMKVDDGVRRTKVREKFFRLYSINFIS